MIRVHVAADLHADAKVTPVSDQIHYLLNVMRLKAGDTVLLFNGRDGEWRAEVSEVAKRGCVLAVAERTRAQAPAPDLELIAALVKRARLETIVEKAAELGCRRVRLVITRRSNADHARVDRLQAIAIEAAEQTGRLDAPEILAPEPLERLLKGWGGDRRLLFCDEGGDCPPARDALERSSGGAWSVLIGPEGGFDAEERARLRSLEGVTAVSLGPRILRADTAAISALTLWQAALGDWRGDWREV